MERVSGTKQAVIHEPSDLEGPYEVPPGLWDAGNTDSIYSRMDPTTEQYFITARLSAPEFFDVGEDELRKLLKERGKYPSVTENQLRLRFWLMFDDACARGPGHKISVSDVCRTICSTDLFFQYLRREEGAAWIACTPLAYESHLKEMLNYGAHRMREIMQISPTTKDGKVNVKLAELQAKLYHAAELRAHGAIPQTVRNLNVNLSDEKTVRKVVEDRGSMQLEDRIALMEKRDRKEKREKEKAISVESIPVDG